MNHRSAPSSWNRCLGLLVMLSLTLGGCSGDGNAGGRMEEAPAGDGRLFTALPAAYTGVAFENRVADTGERNVFTYRNYYNGGGVALGDLTGDGLPELFFTANLDENRLYLNEGAFRFRDVTAAAGVEGDGVWATGVVMVDVDGNGLLDVYVCYAGDIPGASRANELYLHQGLNADGVPEFREAADAYGVADEGYSTHAAFFDYDRDGDLDLYVVNNSPRPVSSFGLRNIRDERHPLGGDRLYRNDGGRFVDVSEEAGIFGSEIAFGLGVAVGDVDGDHWPDVYVSNDFFERDYLYLNDGDGTFTERLAEQMPSISLSSMGLDLADIDNDGRLDLYVTDMLPETDYRLKTTSTFEDWDSYQVRIRSGFHHQFMRNMLHRNNGNGTFSEIGELAGVARTDWSWSALIADLDLDGYKDIYVTNGILGDVTSQDYVSFLANEETMRAAARGERVDFLELIEAMTSTPLPNYAFRNDGHLTFSDVGERWGLNASAFSNGAAFGDLDGDGALDLVVSNVNANAFVYRNNARTLSTSRFLQVRLEGDEPLNRFGVGAVVTVRAGDLTLTQEQMPSRGFQSSVDYVLTFGVGAADSIASVTVDWPDGRTSVETGLASNQRITVTQATSQPVEGPPPSPPPPILRNVTEQVGIEFTHRENEFVDFRREPLMPRMLSMEGPAVAVADVDGDGWDDVFLGGAKDQPGQLLRQRADGTFAAGEMESFTRDQVSEDVGAAFFDADGDGDDDLYVVSGGSEFSSMAPALQDRLYLNDGRGGFTKAQGRIPSVLGSGSTVAPADVDGDGDIDLFVGGRVVPWRYGVDPRSMLLENDGTGRFRDVTELVAPGLAEAGMVTDAAWVDVDGDGRLDLAVVGEWMPVSIFRNTGSGTLDPLDVPGLRRSHGWWNRIVVGEFTGDDRPDLMLGNLGLNSRLRASDEEPTRLYVGDFDRNGFVEQILTGYTNGESYPLALRDDLAQVLPLVRERYPEYRAYAEQTVEDILGADLVAGAEVKEARTFETALARNEGDGAFSLLPLPIEVQQAPVYGILADDVDRDGTLDLLLAGNFDGVKPEIGRMRGGYGWLATGDGSGTFTVVDPGRSGWVIPGQTRAISRIATRTGGVYLVVRNNDRPLVFRAEPGSSMPR